MGFSDSSSSGMNQNAFIAFIFKKNLKAFSFLISSVARGSILATDFKQCLISDVYCDAIRCRRWLLSRARLSLWYDDQSREKSRVIAFFYHWCGANKVFKHFTSGKFAMMIYCLHCEQWFELIARRELITKFKRIRLVFELLQYFWSAILCWEDTVFPTCSALNHLNSSRVCALMFLLILIALMLYLLTRSPSVMVIFMAY